MTLFVHFRELKGDSLTQGQHIASVKEQRINILGFMGQDRGYYVGAYVRRERKFTEFSLMKLKVQ